MITFNNEHHRLIVEADGKRFEVTAICNTVEEANDYCEANPGEGVIDEDRQQGRVYIAKAKPEPKSRPAEAAPKLEHPPLRSLSEAAKAVDQVLAADLTE